MSHAVETHVNGPWRQNCHIVADETGEALVIDPGSDAEAIAALIQRHGWRPRAILNTHAHFDHIGAVAALAKRYDLPFYLHGGDADLLRRANLYRMVFGGCDPICVPHVTHDLGTLQQTFDIGPFRCAWIATPGHTDGSVCFLIEDHLFTGDTLFADAVGRTDLPGGDAAKLARSLRALADLPKRTTVYPGHGRRTTLGAEFAGSEPLKKLCE